ncbi:DUF3549 family protein [Idiomarina xiamenensis]|uniref:DUF3549 domain-containing protein n=1 Tax=Idiomarina xiamenensis 10-D-4 TaxID=740709 RepID=K2KDP8_9GAMM|nr:DUF3549 family protein [Idiomarina xiamenensis]EKE84857.1 hypothetical protein A10D4_04575 [Idiomarina xiamenensis 10-D-4]
MTEVINSLGEFLQNADADYWVFDIGRRLQTLDHEQFAAIEQQRQAYPYPLQRHAWLAVCFWHRQRPQQPYLWFLKLPLDERGLLNSAARNQFLLQVMEALGAQVTAEISEAQQQQLQQNPFLFTPSEDKRAALHAQLQVRRQQPPSIHFEAVQQYFAAQANNSDSAPAQRWQDIGLQGLHDVAARLMQDANLTTQLSACYTQLPLAVLRPLTVALENTQPPPALRDALLRYFTQLNAGERRSLCLRALAGCAEQPMVSQCLRQPLAAAHDANYELDELIVIAARLWPLLDDAKALQQYLLLLSQQPHSTFTALFAELVSLPALRPQLLALLQQTNLPDALQQALQRMRSS